MTKVFNDLLLATDGGQMSAVCLLDLTAAFDTVDHELLLLRLERQFGLRGIVFWLVSVVSVWQNLPCCAQRLFVDHHLHRLLSPTRYHLQTSASFLLQLKMKYSNSQTDS